MPGSGLSGLNVLADVARAARLAGADFQPKMRKSLAKLGPPAKKAVTEQAEKKLPRAGGYAALLARTIRVRVRTDLGFTTAGVAIVTYADGKGARRDVPALNRGILRHPVYGHRRRSWVAQRVPAGFWDDAMDAVSDDAADRVRAVIEETAETILKG